ncbi:MAG: hypothetical protein ACK5ZT_10035 [Sphingobacteriaceae bacterium]
MKKKIDKNIISETVHSNNRKGKKTAQLNSFTPPESGINFTIQPKKLKTIKPTTSQKKAHQRVVKINNVARELDDLWAEVQADATFAAHHFDAPTLVQLKAILKKWISAPEESANPLRTSENRNYTNIEDLGRALVGEHEAGEAKELEKTVASEIFVNPAIRQLVNQAMTTIKHEYTDALPATKGRYSYHYGGLFAGNLQHEVAQWTPAKSLEATIALILDVSLGVRVAANARVTALGQSNNILSPEHEAARATHWNPNESAAWTRHAREHGLPLSAGPSATTGQTLRMLRGAAVSAEQMTAVANAAFAFWVNKAFRHKSGIHTRHEVLSVLAYHIQLLPAPPPVADAVVAPDPLPHVPVDAPVVAGHA